MGVTQWDGPGEVREFVVGGFGGYVADGKVMVLSVGLGQAN